MKRLFFFVFALMISLVEIAPQAEACTSAIISGRLTADGRPILWKHRDTKELNNRVDYHARSKDNKYAFVAIVNGTDKIGQAWMGVNEAGFCIINTASSPMRKFKEDENDQEGYVMYKVLGCCRTVADFEAWLSSVKNQPVGVETNFGVIDAEGGAAYFETNSYTYVKQDVNDPEVAPFGYKVYTNFSPSGKLDEGGGYMRYATASTKLQERAISGVPVTAQWIADNLDRSFYHPLLGIDLVKNPEMTPSGWFYDMDFIPRKSTTSAAVIQGVKKGEDPLLTVMWAILGYPPTSVSVPVMIISGEDQPALVSRISKDDPTCLVCNAALARRAKVFCAKRGSEAPNYLHFSEVYNQEGTGYMQLLAPIEAKNYKDFDVLREKWLKAGKADKAELKAYYQGRDFGLNVK